MVKSQIYSNTISKQDEVSKVRGILYLLDKCLETSNESKHTPYIQQRKIINSLFTQNNLLCYKEQVILRLTIIDSLYSTNAAYSYFSIEEMAEKILSLGNEEAAADYFNGIATQKHTGKILFEERYGIRKNLVQGSKQMSLLSKYAYYLLLQNKERYPLGFPIYDSLAIDQYPKLCRRIFGKKVKCQKDIKDNIDVYVAALDEIRKVLFEGESYNFLLQQFDLLDAYLWRMGKLDAGNISLLLNRQEYTRLIENLKLQSHTGEKILVEDTDETIRNKKEAQFAMQIVKKCKDKSIDVAEITNGIEDYIFKALISHWRNLQD